jgi:hypothetical protein
MVLVDASGGVGAVELLMDGNRIAITYTDGAVQVKDGINGTWRRLVNPGASPGAADVVLQGGRIGILQTDGRVIAKDGLDGAWHILKGGAVALVMQQGYIGVITRDADGRHFLQAKMGLDGAWTPAKTLGPDPITQFRLIVDVPAKPYRVGPGLVADAGWGTQYASNNLMNYAERRSACGRDPDHCYTDRTNGFPVDYYGWFCGAGSSNLGFLDPMDTICRHHDYWQSFYSAWGIGSLGIGERCIVRAVTEKARLTTATGATVSFDLSDRSSVLSAFDTMPATGDALQYFWSWGCTDGSLDDFLNATTSKR